MCLFSLSTFVAGWICIASLLPAALVLTEDVPCRGSAQPVLPSFPLSTGTEFPRTHASRQPQGSSGQNSHARGRFASSRHCLRERRRSERTDDSLATNATECSACRQTNVDDRDVHKRTKQPNPKSACLGSPQARTESIRVFWTCSIAANSVTVNTTSRSGQSWDLSWPARRHPLQAYDLDATATIRLDTELRRGAGALT